MTVLVDWLRTDLPTEIAGCAWCIVDHHRNNARETNWQTVDRGPPCKPAPGPPCKPAPCQESTADESSTVSQGTQLRSRAAPTHPTDPPACGHAPTPTPTHPKRSPQPLIAPRRESPQQSKAAPRRAGPYEVGFAQIKRGIGRGVARDSFAPRKPASPPLVR